MTVDAFDFDRIEVWGPELRALLADIIPENIEDIVVAATPEYIEDARDLLFEVANRNKIADRVSAWIQSRPVVSFHGTRLSLDEIEGIHRDGLRPLVAIDRAERLRHLLSSHPRWVTLEGKLNDAITCFGANQYAGNREGQVHLTVSRAGLIQDFNHYLMFGSEFDQHLVGHLLGDESKALLRQHGKAVLFRFIVPGTEAFTACNRYGVSDENLPNLVSEVLQVWSWRLAHPGYQSESLKLDCGLAFYRPVPATWLVGHEIIADNDIFQS